MGQNFRIICIADHNYIQWDLKCKMTGLIQSNCGLGGQTYFKTEFNVAVETHQLWNLWWEKEDPTFSKACQIWLGVARYKINLIWRKPEYFIMLSAGVLKVGMLLWVAPSWLFQEMSFGLEGATSEQKCGLPCHQPWEGGDGVLCLHCYMSYGCRSAYSWWISSPMNMNEDCVYFEA